MVNREFIFGPQERDQFVFYMRTYEKFCDVRVITYAILSNHFHVVVEVPKKSDCLPPDDYLLAQLSALHGEEYVREIREHLEQWDQDPADRLRQRLWAQMRDVSWFMRLIKQRLSQWYNARNKRKGTLWESRFTSTLIQPDSAALLTVALYVDLNPVRAGLVKDPKDYPWCGYGESEAGHRRAQLGLGIALGHLKLGDNQRSGQVLSLYRKRLVLKGGRANQNSETGSERPPRANISLEEVRRRIVSGAVIEEPQYLMCTIRYFTAGVAIGSKQWINDLFHRERWRFGAKRKDGARQLRGLGGDELFCLRNLKLNVLTVDSSQR